MKEADIGDTVRTLDGLEFEVLDTDGYQAWCRQDRGTHMYFAWYPLKDLEVVPGWEEEG